VTSEATRAHTPPRAYATPTGSSTAQLPEPTRCACGLGHMEGLHGPTFCKRPPRTGPRGLLGSSNERGEISVPDRKAACQSGETATAIFSVDSAIDTTGWPRFWKLPNGPSMSHARPWIAFRAEVRAFAALHCVQPLFEPDQPEQPRGAGCFNCQACEARWLIEMDLA
jgi:hypothetical protein